MCGILHTHVYNAIEVNGMIEIKGVHKRFGKIELLKGVDLTVGEGETLALIGSSGCGKSVLLKIIAGLIEPDEGEVIVDGEKITGASKRSLGVIRKHIGMIFQGNALFDFMDVGENVAFALKSIGGLNQAEISKRVSESLTMVQLEGIENKLINELSGGMKKRVGIARALIAHPQILLTDDPTAGLDPVTSMAIARLLNGIRTRFKTTGITVSTDVDVACNLSDRIAFLADGVIADHGTMSQLCNSGIESVRKFMQSSAITSH